MALPPTPSSPARLALCAALCAALLASLSDCVELTFELPDNAKECFHEVIEEGTEATLEFQVVTGGHYDVDVVLTDPAKKILYKQVKKQYDSHTFKAEATGEYKACFSNEFSTFSHKLVYIDFQVGEEPPLPGVGEHLTAMTQVRERIHFGVALNVRLKGGDGGSGGEPLNHVHIILSDALFQLHTEVRGERDKRGRVL